MSNIFPTMTEAQVLRAQLENAQRDLMRLESEKVHREIAAIEKAKAEDAARGAAVEGEAHAAELERCRASAWLNHRVDVALATGNDAFVALMSDTESLNATPAGWPPGVRAEDFGSVAPDIPIANAAADTRLGRMLFSSSKP
jgi:hypothetical protein